MTTKTKLLPPAINTANYPAGGAFNQVLAWDEAAAQQDALRANQVAAENYATTFSDWLMRYTAGNIPYDSTPPAPPVTQWAHVIETTEDTGALTFSYDLVASPLGTPVCPIPAYTKMPPPSTGQSLMAKLVAEGQNATAGNSNPTIAVVNVGETSTDSAGNVWVRTQ